MMFFRNPDASLRKLERSYRANSDPETLHQLNIVRERSGIEPMLPLEYMQKLFFELRDLLKNPWLDIDDVYYRVQGFFKNCHFVIDAHNLIGPSNDNHTNCYIELIISSSTVLTNAKLIIFPDDVIYQTVVHMPSAVTQRRLSLCEPWIYNAENLLNYAASLILRSNPDENTRELERALYESPADIHLWKKLIVTKLREEQPLLITYFAGKGHPSRYKRRWVTVEIHDINPGGNIKYLHVLPRGWPWSRLRSYKGSQAEEPKWTYSSFPIYEADGFHFGPLTPEEEQENRELAEEQSRREDEMLDRFEGGMY